MKWDDKHGWSLPLRRFNLPCGRNIDLVFFEVKQTYGGLLEGRPTKRLNAQIINRMTYPYKDSDKANKANFQVIPADLGSKIDMASRVESFLPPVYLSLHLESDPFDETEAYSFMTVFYFCDLATYLNLDIAIEKIRSELKWDEFAIDGMP